MSLSEKIFSFMASVKLAVIVILSIAVISAVGTIYEAKYDAFVAKKVVYQSVYMYAVMILLILNLTAVMIDRWPWRWHHLSFVLAHIGIITLLAGSFITQRIGLDGSMSFAMGESNRYVSVDNTELAAFASFGGEGFTQLFRQEVDFFLKSPSKEPFKINSGQAQIEVVDYVHYGVRQSEVTASDKVSAGPALRVQLLNANVNLSQWVVKEKGRPAAEVNLGPAKLILAEEKPKKISGNALVFIPSGKGLAYEVYSAKAGGVIRKGQVQEGDTIQTGWMDMQARILRFLPKAQEKINFLKREYPTPQTRAAIKIRFQDEEYWVGLNSVVRLYLEQSVLFFSFRNLQIDLGFPIKLEKFEVGHYEGTKRAASYQSEVSVPGIGRQLISMNEPLKHNGYTFYQASFEQDETGKPTASILSVNRDPGRFLKYLGSLLIVLGTIMMFYFKRIRRKTA